MVGKSQPIEDWGRLISFQPGDVLRPSSLGELGEALERVHRGELGDGRVRVAGSLHSCSEIVVSDCLLDTSRLPRAVELVEGDGAVEASANVSLHDFLATLGERGRSTTATGGTDHQTLAGVISTGTAPASSRHAMYELLDWVEVMSVDRSSGEAGVRRIERGDPDFDAAICSLGLLGVITRVRFRLVEERHFAVEQRIVELDEVLSDLDATSRRYDFWRVNWMQRSEKALLWAARRIPAEESEPGGDYPTDRSEQVLDFVFQVLDRFSDTGPLLNGPLEALYRTLALTYGEKRSRGPLRNMLPVDRRAPLRVAMAEWSFRPGDLHLVLGECREYFGEHGWPNIPTEIELTRTDEAMMSPWSWDGLEYVVKLNFMYLTEVCTEPGEKEEIHTHLRGLWDHLRGAGIPFKAHWGKVNFIEPELARANHRLEQFAPLASPMFLNDHLAERIGGLAR